MSSPTRAVTRARVEQVIEALVVIARPLVVQTYRVDSCILSTKIAVEVCRRLGVRAQALAVELIAAVEGNTWRHSAIGANSSEDRFHVRLGTGSEDSPWSGRAGHIVALLDNSRLLLDLSLDQVSSLSHGLILTPRAFPVEKAMVKGAIHGRRFGDTALVYKPYPEDRSFVAHADWRSHGRSEPIVRRTLAALE